LFYLKPAVLLHRTGQLYNESTLHKRNMRNTFVQDSDDSIYRKYRYVVFDIDVSYSIVSSKKISNFSIYRAAISSLYHVFLIYRDILRQKFISLLLHCQNNENKRRKRQTNQNKETIVS